MAGGKRRSTWDEVKARVVEVARERDRLLDLLRRVFMATPSSIGRPDHDPEGLWQALGYDAHDGLTDTDCQMERHRADVEALLRDVNAALGCALPIPPHVPCEEVDDAEPCERCKAWLLGDRS